MAKLTYTTALKYVPTWTLKDVYRELESNCIDTGAEYSVKLEGTTLTFKDAGEGLKIRQLLFGVSEKSNTDTAIGQFGEGLKLALLVLTRMGKTVEISSGDLYIINGTSTIDGTEVMELDYEHTSYQLGTTITIHGWDAPTYEDMFINNNKSLILFETANGNILDCNDLYVKGVKTSTFDNSLFGYDLNVTMNRDRKSVSEDEVSTGIGNVWKNITDPDLWEMLFTVISNKSIRESNLYFTSMTPATKQAIHDGFHQAFGKNACLYTDMAYAKEAEHRKGNVINLEAGYWLKNIIANAVETDKAYVTRLAGDKSFKVSESSLTPEQLSNLRKIRKLTVKLGYDGKNIIVADIPHAVANCNLSSGVIQIRPERLDKLATAISDLIHELGHWVSKSADFTDNHVNAITDLVSRIVTENIHI